MLLKTIIKKYIMSIIFFTILVFIFNIIIGSEFSSYFSRIFFDGGNEIFEEGQRYIEGRLKITQLIKASIFLLYFIYTVIFVDQCLSNYFSQQYSEKKLILDIHKRIELILSGKELPVSPKLLEIDNLIKDIINEENEVKKRFDEQMSKFNLSMAFLAHDLRTPLTSIIGYINLLADEKELSLEARNKYYNIIQNKSNELEQLVDQFFGFTKVQLQVDKLIKRDFDLYNFFVQIKETFYPYLTNKNLTLDVFIPERTMIVGDPNQLARCFNNVLKNAVLYSPEKSEIKVCYYKNEGKHNITIENKFMESNGIDIENVFEPFYRGDYSRSKAEKGAGLGLSIAKTIIQRHNGDISVMCKNGFIIVEVRLPM